MPDARQAAVIERRARRPGRTASTTLLKAPGWSSQITSRQASSTRCSTLHVGGSALPHGHEPLRLRGGVLTQGAYGGVSGQRGVLPERGEARHGDDRDVRRVDLRNRLVQATSHSARRSAATTTRSLITHAFLLRIRRGILIRVSSSGRYRLGALPFDRLGTGSGPMR